MVDGPSGGEQNITPDEGPATTQSEGGNQAPRGIVLTADMVLGLLAAALIIFGSFGTWVMVGPLGVSGINGDGAITLAAGIIGALVVAFGRWHPLALVASVAAAGTAIYDMARIGDTDDSFLAVSVGWGLIAVLVGAFGLAAWALFALSQRPDKRVAFAGGALAGVAVVVLTVLALVGTFGTVSESTEVAAADETSVDTTETPAPTSAAPQRAMKSAEIGGQIRLTGANDVEMVATVERVIDPAYGGEFDEPSDGKRYVAVVLRLTNVGSASYSDSPGNGATLTYGDDQEAESSTLSGGECASGFASGTKIRPESRRKGCLVFEVPATNTIKTFQFALDSGFSDDTGEWNVRPANGTAAARETRPAPEPAPAEVPAPAAEEMQACDQNISSSTATTCAFANAVFKDYAAQLQAGDGPDTSATVAGRTVYCGYDGTDVTCSGDGGELVTFPKWAADVY